MKKTIDSQGVLWDELTEEDMRWWRSLVEYSKQITEKVERKEMISSGVKK